MQYIGDERIAQLTLDQIGKAGPNEPNAAVHPQPSPPAREENSVEPKESNAPADGGPTGRHAWLWAVPVLLFAGVLAGFLCLRRAKGRP